MTDLQHPLFFLLSHPTVILMLMLAYVFVIIVGAMPPLPANSGFFTVWAYAVAQVLAGNFKQLAHMAAQAPQVKAYEATLLKTTTGLNGDVTETAQKTTSTITGDSSQMTKVLVVLVALFTLCGVSQAQVVSNLYMAGASYSAGATSSPVAGSALYAHAISPDTTNNGMYAFTAIDAVPNTLRPFTVTSNVGIGIAEKLFTIGRYSVFVPTSAGISWSGTNTGWQWSAGAGVPIKLKSTADGGSFYVMPTVRVLKSSVSNGTGYQPIIGLLFGFGK